MGPPSVCWKCHGLRGFEDKKDATGAPYPDALGRPASGPGLFAWMNRRLTPEARDKHFANLVGLISAAGLGWYAYTRGFGAAWYWNVGIPVLGGFLVAKALGWMGFLTRSLRLAATAAVWLVLLAAAVLLVQLFLKA